MVSLLFIFLPSILPFPVATFSLTFLFSHPFASTWAASPCMKGPHPGTHLGFSQEEPTLALIVAWLWDRVGRERGRERGGTVSGTRTPTWVGLAPGHLLSAQWSSWFPGSFPSPVPAHLSFLECCFLSSPFCFFSSLCPGAKGEGTLCLRKQVLLFIASRRSNPHLPVS